MCLCVETGGDEDGDFQVFFYCTLLFWFVLVLVSLAKPTIHIFLS